MSYADFVFGSDATGVGVKSVEATDTYTVTCTMRSPCAPFLRNLAMALGTPIVSPTALAKANGDMPRLPAACRASQAMTSNTPLRPLYAVVF